MANIDISKLPPELQKALFEASKQSGQQPTSGGIPMDQASMADAPPMPLLPRQPGDKMDPNEAMQIIQQRFSQQLGQNKEGQLTEKVPTGQPILDLLGVKVSRKIKSPDFFTSAKQAGLDRFLPNNLPRTPEGNPFVDAKTYQTALQTAQSFGDKTRAPYYTMLGFEEGSNLPVTFDAASKRYFKGDKEVSGNEVQRLLSKTKPQLGDGQMNDITNLLNAKSQLDEVKALFDPNAVGPVQSRLYDASKKMGINLNDLKGMAAITDDKARLRTVLASGINDYIKAITGAQMSEIEARRIMAAMPDANANEEAFMPVLQQVIAITETKYKNKLDVLESQGTVGIDKLRKLMDRKPAPSEPKPKSDKADPAPAGKPKTWAELKKMKMGGK